MQATVEWRGGLRMEGRTEDGRTVAMDAGDSPQAPAPMQLVLVALGGCTAMDVADILSKMGQPLQSLRVELEGERASKPPRVLKRVTIRYVVGGKGLSPAKVQRAINLSTEKYCSVLAMLRGGGVALTQQVNLEGK